MLFFVNKLNEIFDILLKSAKNNASFRPPAGIESAPRAMPVLRSTAELQSHFMHTINFKTLH